MISYGLAFGLYGRPPSPHCVPWLIHMSSHSPRCPTTSPLWFNDHLLRRRGRVKYCNNRWDCRIVQAYDNSHIKSRTERDSTWSGTQWGLFAVRYFIRIFSHFPHITNKLTNFITNFCHTSFTLVRFCILRHITAVDYISKEWVFLILHRQCDSFLVYVLLWSIPRYI